MLHEGKCVQCGERFALGVCESGQVVDECGHRPRSESGQMATRVESCVKGQVSALVH